MSSYEVLGSIPEEQVSHCPVKCSRLREGQVFHVNEQGECVDDFPCAWAWQDLHSVLKVMRNDGHFAMKKKKGIQYSCCTDGAMPVIFKIEREDVGASPVAGMQKEGNTRIPLQIEVTKCMQPEEIYGHIPEGLKPEPALMTEGQTFLVPTTGRKPDGFPDEAWSDIYAYVLTLQLGGNLEGNPKGVGYCSTTSGLSTVFFKLKCLDANQDS